MAVEEIDYRVIEQDGAIEIRDYAPYIVAETRVEGDVEEAGNRAFGKLFRYISGKNQTRDKIAMTAPVEQQPASQKIAMTAPVEQQAVDGQWAVSFAMPSSYTMDTLPEPQDASITLREVPTRRMAAIRYSGLWSEKRYRQHHRKLADWIQKQGLTPVGDAVWARYDPPFMPWFLRRNEVLIPIAITEPNRHDSSLSAEENPS